MEVQIIMLVDTTFAESKSRGAKKRKSQDNKQNQPEVSDYRLTLSGFIYDLNDSMIIPFK